MPLPAYKSKLPQELRQKLIDAAIEAKSKAYCIYSNFQVGAAVLSPDHKIYAGCNLETANYHGSCAEKSAMCNALLSAWADVNSLDSRFIIHNF